jgi:hypothetical protein
LQGGGGIIAQSFLTAQEFLSLSDMFRNGGPITFNTVGNYFVTASKPVG